MPQVWPVYDYFTGCALLRMCWCSTGTRVGTGSMTRVVASSRVSSRRFKGSLSQTASAC